MWSVVSGELCGGLELEWGGFTSRCSDVTVTDDWYYCFRRPFYDKRISAEVDADFLGDEWKVICQHCECTMCQLSYIVLIKVWMCHLLGW